MATSSYYQDLAVSMGYIQQPFKYTLPSPEQPQVVQSQATASTSPKFPTKIIDSGLKKADQVNQKYSYNDKFYNSNAPLITQMGNEVVQGSKGQQYDVATPIAQYLADMQQKQGDKMDVVENVFGSGNMPEGHSYSSDTQRKDYLAKIGDFINRGIGQDPSNPFLNWKDQTRAVSNQLNQGGNVNYAKESLDVTGQGQKGKSLQEQVNLELGKLNNPDLRKAVWDNNQQKRDIESYIGEISNYRPTTANLPIEEKVIQSRSYGM